MIMKDLELIQGDARKLPLGDGLVQCVVTSPPYWGLRKYLSGEQELVWGGFPKIDPGSLKAIPCKHEFYGEDVSDVREETASGKSRTSERFYGEESRKFNGNHQKHFQTYTCVHCGAWRGAFGLEPTIEMYIAHTVEILRECRRVLRSNGVLFWNIGDSYANDGKWGGATGGKHVDELHGDNGVGRAKRISSLKPKDLCLIPSRVALAAQADGWWVRSMIVWVKPNPMPESVTDRPTNAYEHILMLTKSERYFFDGEAVRESVTGNAHERGDGVNPKAKTAGANSRVYQDRDPSHFTRPKQNPSFSGAVSGLVSSRNLRNVWTFATQPYAEAHFATFPEELPRRCILAATSAMGACGQCGAPWERVTRAKFYGNWNPGPGSNGPLKTNAQTEDRKGDAFTKEYQPPQTIGWRPTCLCRGQRGKTVPCLVLDPFAGSGTTGRVALELGRRAVLVDLAYGAKDEYRKLAERRTREVQTVFPL